MPAKTRCPECRATFDIPSRDKVGKKIKCPKCGDPFVVRPLKKKKSVKKRPPADDDWDIEDEAAPMAPPPIIRKSKKGSKKSSQSKKAEGEDSNRTILMVATCGGAVVVLCIVLFLASKMGGGGGEANAEQAAAAANVEFVTYMQETSAFKIDHPPDWKAKGGGGTGGVPAWATVESSNASVSVRTSPSGTAIGAAALATGDDSNEDLAPVVETHAFMKEKVAADYDSYEETKGVKVDVAVGDARMSTFTLNAGVFGGGTQTGYRVTILNVNHTINIMCKCSPSDFESLKPVFEKMILSVK